MVELEKKNSMIQLVPSTPNLQMTCTWGGVAEHLTLPIRFRSARGWRVGACCVWPMHWRPDSDIFPALPPSVVPPREVLPPWCLHPGCRGLGRGGEGAERGGGGEGY